MGGMNRCGGESPLAEGTACSGVQMVVRCTAHLASDGEIGLGSGVAEQLPVR